MLLPHGPRLSDMKIVNPCGKYKKTVAAVGFMEKIVPSPDTTMLGQRSGKRASHVSEQVARTGRS